jgi:hypothetical protein
MTKTHFRIIRFLKIMRIIIIQEITAMFIKLDQLSKFLIQIPKIIENKSSSSIGWEGKK